MITYGKSNIRSNNSREVLTSKMKHQIRDDISRCENVTEDKKELLAKELLNKYAMGYEGFAQDIDSIENANDKIISIKNRLDVILSQKLPPKIANRRGAIDIRPIFNNSNVINVSISFEEARKQIDNMSNLSREEYDEINEKINQLEEIVNSQESRKQKWTMAKSIFKWLAEVGVDVGIAFLPLLLNIK